MASPARFAALRRALERHLAPLIPEIENLFETELSARVSTEVETRSGKLLEALNQSVRRLRQSSGFEEAAAVLAEATSPFCSRAAVFQDRDGMLRLAAGRGAALRVEVALERVGAFRAARETGDPVIALATEGEVSRELLDAFSHAAGERVAVFPVGGAGFLYAWGDAQTAALELLAQVAGALPALPKKAQPGALVEIAPAPRTETAAWTGMDPKEQRLHLRAQQYARAEIAQIRLHRSGLVKEGRERGDLYGVLGREIEAVREEFKRKFVPATPSMVDYVHVELVRTLANDNAVLLGSGYPGPLV